MEDTMTSHFRHGAILLALLGSLGTAVAQTAPAGNPPTAPVAGTIDPKAGLQLTPQQRAMIFQSVSKEKAKVKLPPGGISASAGAELPPSIELYTVPDDVAAEIPNAKLYKYTVVNDQVVLVDPTSMKVVEVIRR
jgi:hypothetical protein